MDSLTDLADCDLGALLEAFRTVGQGGNRLALDMFCIVEREMLRRHKSTKIVNYTDREIFDVVGMLAGIVDDARAKGVPDDQPAMEFMLTTITDLAGEVESRGLVQTIQ